MKRAVYWCVSFALVMGGCVAGEVGGHVDGYVDDGSIPTFAEFERATYHEPFEGGVYIVNGDTPIANIKLLREFYDSLYTASLIVHRNGNSDSKWSNTQKRNITYCISNNFGSRKSQVVSAMQQAAEGGWEQAADVDFIYVPEQDGNCTGSNNNVVFDIRPTSGASYLARAFFPYQSRSTRNVIIDSSAFNSGWSLASVLAHELGHTLGFRHEHTRPESGACFEDNSWRPLTPYDSASIMHYPQCNGSTNSLSFTQLDFNGAAELYGAPTGGGDGGGGGGDGGGGGGDGGGDGGGGTTGTARSGSASGSLARRQQHNYNPLSVVPGSPFEVRMTGSGDADLYVRFDSQPTLSSYACRPYLNGSTETCSLDVPAGASQAYIMVYGYTSASYTINVDWVEP